MSGRIESLRAFLNRMNRSLATITVVSTFV
ncbi:MAG: hypothetical protein ACI9WU_004384, partial [Myxococcota bacterium]